MKVYIALLPVTTHFLNFYGGSEDLVLGAFTSKDDAENECSKHKGSVITEIELAGVMNLKESLKTWQNYWMAE